RQVEKGDGQHHQLMLSLAREQLPRQPSYARRVRRNDLLETCHSLPAITHRYLSESRPSALLLRYRHTTLSYRKRIVAQILLVAKILLDWLLYDFLSILASAVYVILYYNIFVV